MECRARRSRRGRAHPSNPPYTPSCTVQFWKPWNFLNSFYSFLILTSLIGVIYLMLDYHCNTCTSKCDLSNINKSIEDIAKNLAVMKNGYCDLELKITRFSQELPKIQGQIEIIEALANAIEGKESGWDPKVNIPLPNVDVFLNNLPHDLRKNVTKCKCAKCLS